MSSIRVSRRRVARSARRAQRARDRVVRTHDRMVAARYVSEAWQSYAASGAVGPRPPMTWRVRFAYLTGMVLGLFA